MTWTVTDILRAPLGNKQLVIQKGVSAGGSTGGAFATGLARVEAAYMSTKGASAIANVGVINATFPQDSGSVTVVSNSNETVYLLSIGNG